MKGSPTSSTAEYKRKASKRYRIKKGLQVEELEKQVGELELEKNQLENGILALTQENQFLREQQEYLRNFLWNTIPSMQFNTENAPAMLNEFPSMQFNTDNAPAVEPLVFQYQPSQDPILYLEDEANACKQFQKPSS